MSKANQQPTITCPVRGCGNKLPLVPHPQKPGRLVAYCACKSRFAGKAVYERDAEPVEKPAPDVQEVKNV